MRFVPRRSLSREERAQLGGVHYRTQPAILLAQFARAAKERLRKTGASTAWRARGCRSVFELARHLTWRDREIALCLYDHQVLSTGQLQPLFFTSRRRCQDRLLFLYRHRVLDRFYPPGPFGSGKPQAHWLLDEAGPILAAASLGVRDQAARLVAPGGLVLAPPARAPAGGQPVRLRSDRRDTARSVHGSDRLGLHPPRRQAPRQPPVCATRRWRGQAARCYAGVQRAVRRSRPEPHHDAAPGLHALEPKRERHRQDSGLVNLDGCWPMLATATTALHHAGPLSRVWESIANPAQPPVALGELPVSQALGPANPACALGRRSASNTRPSATSRPSSKAASPPSAASSASRA
jgi:hypothetical protein